MDRSSLHSMEFAALSTFMASKLSRTRSCFMSCEARRAHVFLVSKRKRGIVGAGAMIDGSTRNTRAGSLG